MIRRYVSKYLKWFPEKWSWKPGSLEFDNQMEAQQNWNDLYLKTRARKTEDISVPDIVFRAMELDAEQFGKTTAKFTDICGLTWVGEKGTQELVGPPDYEGHLYYFNPDSDYSDEPGYVISEYYSDEEHPPMDVYAKLKEDWIDIANITDINYKYFVENHLFKDSIITIYYSEFESERIYDYDFSYFITALVKFKKFDLLKKLMNSINEHFEALKNSEREEDREYYPNVTSWEYFGLSEKDF